MTTTTFINDRRWSPGASGAVVPQGARAAYAARWIDYGSRADIVPDRQGFGYDDPADRDELMALLQALDPASKVAALDRDVTVDLTPGARDVQVWVRRAGGYFYVEAWLPAYDVEDDDVPADWPVRPLAVGAPMTDTTATCGTCGRSWDDAIITSMTPAPSARCPFEPFHDVEVCDNPEHVDPVECSMGDCGDEPYLDDWKYEVANGDTWLGFVQWRADRQADEAGTEEYRFVVDGVEHTIVASSPLEAYGIANRTLDLPRDFYAWMDSGPNRYYATTGVWD